MKKSELLIPALLAVVALGCRSQSDETQASAAKAQAAEAARPVVDAPKPAVEVAKPAVEAAQAAERAVSAPMADGKLLAKVGQPAPNFALKDLNGKEHTLAQYKGKTVVLEWFSPGCPYCVYAYGDGSLKTMPEQYMKDGMVWLSVNSEAPENKAASVEMNRTFIEKNGMKAPLLMDPTGIVGRSYGAKSTPHVFVIDPKGVLVYQGALDNAPLGKVADDAAKIDYVGDAVAAIKAGTAPKVTETKSYG